MRALTIRQPWAQLIACGRKRIETRSWGTDHRGPLAIHAGKAMTLEGRVIADLEANDVGALPRGYVVAIADLADVVPWEEFVRRPRQPWCGDSHTEWWREEKLGDFRYGRQLWLLADVRPLEVPVPAKGRLGLWWWEDPTA